MTPRSTDPATDTGSPRMPTMRREAADATPTLRTGTAVWTSLPDRWPVPVSGRRPGDGPGDELSARDSFIGGLVRASTWVRAAARCLVPGDEPESVRVRAGERASAGARSGQTDGSASLLRGTGARTRTRAAASSRP